MKYLVILAVMLLLPAAYATDGARLQVVHNAADPGAAEVDVWVNGDLFIDNFEFREATPFVDVPAGANLQIGIAPPSSVSAAESLATFDVVLDAGQKYIANGVLTPGDFSDNPDSESTAFTLLVAGDAQEEGMSGSGNVDLLALHGATDAPEVDVVARGFGIIVDDLQYKGFAGYVSVPAASYILDITPSDDNEVGVACYDVDLSGLGGGAALVFASGFLNPSANQDGETFGLFAALPNGDVIELPECAEPIPEFSLVAGVLAAGLCVIAYMWVLKRK
jgi:hypothetical protein